MGAECVQSGCRVHAEWVQSRVRSGCGVSVESMCSGFGACAEWVWSACGVSGRRVHAECTVWVPMDMRWCRVDSEWVPGGCGVGTK